jgi:hypothetical protein
MSKSNKKVELGEAMGAMVLCDNNDSFGEEDIDWEWVEEEYFGSVEDWGEEGVDWEWGPGYRPNTSAKRAKAVAKKGKYWRLRRDSQGGVFRRREYSDSDSDYEVEEVVAPRL